MSMIINPSRFAPAGPTDPHWASVVLLASFDGANGATSTLDKSSKGRAITFNDTAVLDTSQKQFGASSLYMPANGWLSCPNHTDLLFGDGQFTVEMFYKPNTDTNTYKLLCGVFNAAANQKSWGIFHDTSSIANALVFLVSVNGTTTNTAMAATPGFNLNGTSPFRHVAVDYNGSKYRMYCDGVMIDSNSTPRNLFASTALFTIGDQSPGNVNPNRGWIDELRITKGVARYNSDAGFTVPASAYPTS